MVDFIDSRLERPLLTMHAEAATMTLTFLGLFTIVLSQLRATQQWALVATLTVVMCVGKAVFS